MDRNRYPKNWDAIAQAVKDEANWHCEECDRPCRKPGVNQFDFEEWLLDEHPDWSVELYEEVETEEFGLVPVPRFQRFTLTVAHLDHTPENCDRANLRALCAPCHCRYDLAAMATKKRLKAERLGQLNLGV